MKRMFAIGFVSALALILGCVNIPKKFEAHITVDIRHHIEQQAESTLDFIEGKSDEIPVPPPPAPAQEKTSALGRVWQALDPMPVAHAEALKNTSPEITRIATELRKRFDQIQAIKARGHAGESNRGYLELRNPDTLSPAERNEMQRLIAAENADRKALYEEVAKLNAERQVTVAMVEAIYAMERLQRAKPGEVYQLPAGDDYAKFQKSPVAKRVGADAAPGAWVTIK